MATLNGKLLTVADPTAGDMSDAGSVTIALCGYGSQVPSNPGGILVKLEQDISTASGGIWTAQVAGNDIIQPAGTYYTVTYRDSNGDIAQCNAYQFADSGSYNLAATPPYDPNQPPPPLPPLLQNVLESLAFTATPIFDGTNYAAWQITLTGDITSSTTANVADGNLYTFVITQDGTGGHQFTWPTNVRNATLVNTTANGMTVQTFVAYQGILYPIGAGSYYP